MPTPRKGETRRKFVSRCMGDSEARSTFPERVQRFAVCNSLWEKVRRKSAAEFRLAKATCCELHKVDIPEVQAVIRLLSRPASAELRRIANEVLEALEERLDELVEQELGTSDAAPLVEAEDRDDLLAALLASLFLIVTGQVRAPFSPRLQGILGAAADSLLDDGAESLGLSLTGSRRALLRRAAMAEMEVLLRGSILGREDEIREALREALTSARARRALTPLELAGLGPRLPGEPPRARQEVLGDVRVAVSGEKEPDGSPPTGPGSRAGATADGWAYRWYSIGAFEAAMQQGGAAFFRAVNNPPRGPDEKTTPFCRWVHGRIISAGRARAQVDRHVQLALSGDFDGLVSNWPFLDPAIARGGAEDEFATFFRGAGLPPYHWNCRTVVQVVPLSQL